MHRHVDIAIEAVDVIDVAHEPHGFIERVLRHQVVQPVGVGILAEPRRAGDAQLDAAAGRRRYVRKRLDDHMLPLPLRESRRHADSQLAWGS